MVGQGEDQASRLLRSCVTVLHLANGSRTTEKPSAHVICSSLQVEFFHVADLELQMGT